MQQFRPYRPWIVPGKTPAFSEDFYNMHWREVEAFVEEMKSRIPERLGELERYVRRTRGFGTWKANRTRKSLQPVGPWLLKVLTTRRLTRAERMPKILKPLPPPLTPKDVMVPSFAPDFIISEECQGVLVDVGLYFGECLRKANPKWYWRRSTARRQYSDYNQPTLAFDRDTIGGYLPFSSPMTVASQIMDGDMPQTRFYDMFAEYRETFE
jgi:hypothetical protein